MFPPAGMAYRLANAVPHEAQFRLQFNSVPFLSKMTSLGKVPLLVPLLVLTCASEAELEVHSALLNIVAIIRWQPMDGQVQSKRIHQQSNGSWTDGNMHMYL